MLERLTALYRAGKIGAAELDNAVARGWITAEQRDAIVAGA